MQIVGEDEEEISLSFALVMMIVSFAGCIILHFVSPSLVFESPTSLHLTPFLLSLPENETNLNDSQDFKNWEDIKNQRRMKKRKMSPPSSSFHLVLRDSFSDFLVILILQSLLDSLPSKLTHKLFLRLFSRV
jgi:hypothetical protein